MKAESMRSRTVCNVEPMGPSNLQLPSDRTCFHAASIERGVARDARYSHRPYNFFPRRAGREPTKDEGGSIGRLLDSVGLGLTAEREPDVPAVDWKYPHRTNTSKLSKIKKTTSLTKKLILDQF